MDTTGKLNTAKQRTTGFGRLSDFHGYPLLSYIFVFCIWIPVVCYLSVIYFFGPVVEALFINILSLNTSVLLVGRGRVTFVNVCAKNYKKSDNSY